jgi:hypothetical protein
MPLEVSHAEADLRKEGSCWTSQSSRLDITGFANVLAHAMVRDSEGFYSAKVLGVSKKMLGRFEVSQDK